MFIKKSYLREAIKLEVMKMKKVNAILVITLFMLSLVPLSIAHDGVDHVTEEEALRHEKEVSSDKDDDYEEEYEDGDYKIKEKRKIKNGKEEYELRLKLDKERQEFRLKAIDEKKEHYAALRDRYRERKDAFIEHKTKYRRCQDDDSEACDGIRGDALEHGKAFLLRASEVFIEHIDKIIERIENSDMEGKEEKILELSRCSENVNSEMENVKGSSSIEELRENGKKLHEAMKECKELVVNSGKEAYRKSVERLMKHGRALNSNLEKLLKYIERKQIDVDIEDEAAEIQNGLDKAKGLFDAKDYKGAQEALKEVHPMLKDLIKKVREAGVSPDEATEEVE
jgi:hypothetical protein